VLGSRINQLGRRRRAAGVAVAALAVVGATVYGVAPVSAKSAPKTPKPHCSSYTNMNVGYVPSLSGLSLLVGAKLGIFKAECLNVTPTLVASPPNSYPELLAGQLQALDGSGLVTATFVGNGAPINIIGGEEVESTSVGNNKNNWWQIITLKSNKTITNINSLIGQSVGVAQLNSFTELAVENYLSSEGQSPTGIKWVVIPQAQQLAALQAGEVQALYAGEPYLTQDEQITPIKTVYSGSPAANTPVGAYTMTTAYESANPTVLKEFQKAIPLAYAAILTHKPLAESLIKASLSLTEATVKRMHFPNYVKKFPVAAEDTDLQLELKFGYIKTVPPNSQLFDLGSNG
jgi:NitT/TauT family transport system substrate-binding protein